ncbi:MAG: FmdB family zinc ribbon protein [Phycisphaerae bacterium]
MPLFEFHCDACEREFELLVSLKEKPVCPDCGSARLERLMSVSAGHVAGQRLLPMAGQCPPPEAGPCSPGCCRIPG